MKKVVYILLGFLALLGIMVGVIFYLTADVPKAADRFFTLIKEHKTQEAYKSTAKTFQSVSSFEDFKTFIEKNSLTKYQSAFWDSRSIDNNKASLTGIVTTSEKAELPMTIQFVKEENVWKVTHVAPAKAGVDATESEKPVLPEDEKILTLTNEAMGFFGEAIVNDDFTDFHRYISKTWQAQITAKELLESFEKLRKEDFIGREGVDPVFSQKPSFDEDGLLHLIGYYPFKDTNIGFELKFIYEHPNWKLFGIRTGLIPLEDATSKTQ